MRYGFSNTKESYTESTTALQTITTLATKEQQPTESLTTTQKIKHVFVQRNPISYSCDQGNDLLGSDDNDVEVERHNATTESIRTGEFFMLRERQKALISSLGIYFTTVNKMRQ